MGFLADLKIKRAFKNIKKLLAIYDALGFSNAEEDREFIEELEKAYRSRDYEAAFRLIDGREERDETELE